MSEIPLHCLVLCSDQSVSRFAAHECLSTAMIARDLVGDRWRELGQIVFMELVHRVSLKLSLGERVIVAAQELSTAETQQLLDLAHEQGASIIAELPNGLPVTPGHSFDQLRNRYRGITVVGDVHGDLDQLVHALEWARSRQHFVWLLGDVIDYGPNSLACVETAYRAVMHGEAAMLIGNHERKIARWLEQRHTRLSNGNRVTTEAINRLKPAERKRWIGQFRGLLAHASLLTHLDNVTLVHAAAHPTLWTVPDQHLVEQFALYGQGETNGKFRRVHRWVDAVPDGKLVVVGHDMIAPLPMVMSGLQGGKVVFLDTGCGKGGHLSTADLRFGETGLFLECFNRHHL